MICEHNQSLIIIFMKTWHLSTGHPYQKSRCCKSMSILSSIFPAEMEPFLPRNSVEVERRRFSSFGEWESKSTCRLPAVVFCQLLRLLALTPCFAVVHKNVSETMQPCGIRFYKMALSTQNTSCLFTAVHKPRDKSLCVRFFNVEPFFDLDDPNEFDQSRPVSKTPNEDNWYTTDSPQVAHPPRRFADPIRFHVWPHGRNWNPKRKPGMMLNVMCVSWGIRIC